MNEFHFIQHQAETLAQICDALEAASLTIHRSFHLADAVKPSNSQLRNKALTVLLVYGNDPMPATIVVRGHRFDSWVSVDRSAGALISAEFMSTLTNIIIDAVPTIHYAPNAPTFEPAIEKYVCA